MELALALCACIFALLSFVMASATLIYVLARRFSTVELRQVPVPVEETRYEVDGGMAAGVDGPEPRPPVSLTSSEHEKFERMRQAEARFEAAVESDDYEFGL